MFFNRTHGPFVAFRLMATMHLGAFEMDAVIGGANNLDWEFVGYRLL